MSLHGKVVVITGASGAIGQAAARAFDRAGAKLVLASRRKEILEKLAAEMKEAKPVQVDLSDIQQARDLINQSVELFGRIDILLNIAATIIVDRSEKVSSEDLVKAFTANLAGPVAATQEALAVMRKQGNGHIINVGSPGFMMGIPLYAPYVCSKAAFSAWTRTIQAEWSNEPVKISEYFPGYIRTDSKAESRLGIVDQDFLMAEKQNFLSRYFTGPKTPEHVAKQLVCLAEKPKPLVYSGFLVRLGAFLSNIPSFRIRIASQMAQNAEKKLNPQQTP